MSETSPSRSSLPHLAKAAHDPSRTASLPPVRFNVEGAVPVIEAADASLVEYILQNRPVIIRNSDLAGTAVERWDVQYLAQHLGDSNRFDIYAGRNNLCFRYYDPEKNTGGYRFKPFTKKHSLTFREFLERLAENAWKGKSEDKMYHYFQQTLYEGVGESIAKDVKGFRWDLLTTLRAAAPAVLGGIKSSVVWIGPAGVVTPVHYDEAHNLFCQVRGSKRFYVLPPDAFPSLYPYPVAHACDRQSQVDVYAPDLDRFPRFPQARALEATLSQGDVLYLPACWWHHVESLSDSVSVNFWLEQAAADPKAVQRPLPPHVLLSVRRNVEKMLASVVPPREVGPFLRELVEGRFEWADDGEAAPDHAPATASSTASSTTSSTSLPPQSSPAHSSSPTQQ